MGIGTKTMGICMGTSELERRKAARGEERTKKGKPGGRKKEWGCFLGDERFLGENEGLLRKWGRLSEKLSDIWLS